MSYITLELAALPADAVAEQIDAVKALAAVDPNIQITIEFTGVELLALFDGSAATADKPAVPPKTKPVEPAADKDAATAAPTRFRRTKAEAEAGLTVEQAQEYRASGLSLKAFLAKQDENEEEAEDTASATDEDDSSDEGDEDDADIAVDGDEEEEPEVPAEPAKPAVSAADLLVLAKKAIGFPGLTSEERRPHLTRVLKKYDVARFSEIGLDKIEEAAADLNTVLAKFKKLVAEKS
jgi:hypothetical protein